MKMFCPKCGSILVPKKEGSKKVMSCTCGYKTKNIGNTTIKEEKTEKTKDVEVVEHTDINTLPKMDTECPKCGHKKAYFWLVQTRAGDEPETKFLKCEKCGHTWRDYS
ncbi:transcription factor S [Candidatus Woesearchaeota archaeon]|nr:transcription factor S [Candidatus Woesearchaeota archaeon]